MEKLRGALLLSVIALSMFAFTGFIKPADAAYPFGTHRIYFNYYGTSLAYDHDGDVWPFTNKGEWYFRLYYGSTYRYSSKYSVDKDRNGWKYVNHVDLIEQSQCTPQTYKLWAGEDDGGPGWDYTASYTTYIPSNWGYYSQYRPNQYHYRDEKVGDVWFNWYYYIYNDAPTVSSISGYSSGYRKVAYTFSANSYDPEGDSMTYQWKVDGKIQSTTGPSLTYTFPTSAYIGTHYIYVQAWDYFGLTDNYDGWKTKTFTISNRAPTVGSISGPSSGHRKVAYTFQAFGSDPDGDSITYVWTVDGWTQSATGSSMTKTFPTSASIGSHIIKVRTKDSKGMYSSYSSKTFTISNRAPTVGSISGPSSGYPGVPYTYFTTGSDPDGDSITYQWQVNGTTQPATGSSMTYTFPTAGTYTVRVRAKDSYSAYSSYSSKTVTMRLGGDVNGDGDVDHKDLLLLASAYGSEAGDPNYIPEADINGDGKVDHVDLLILAGNYGKEQK